MHTFPQTRRKFIGSSLATLALLNARHLYARTSDPTELSILEAARLMRSGSLSPVELTSAYLQRIRRYDPHINSYISVTDTLALEQAGALQDELAAGRWRGPLHGVPIALKDNIDTAGIPTTAASALFARRVPATDAEVVRRLKQAGAILLGKLNMHEFAFGGSSAVTHYGPVHNPWDLDYIPGGSSGGSAAAVSARLCAAALGTDTAASIRMPAAYCGIAGLKPTHGLASIRGIIPISESIDHVGPMCRSVADTALMLQAIAGYDPDDVSSIRVKVPQYSQALFQPVSDLRLGIPREPFYSALDPDIDQGVAAALTVLGELTASTREVTLPETPPFGPILAEAWSYHADYLTDPVNHALYQPFTLKRLQSISAVPMRDYHQALRGLALARKAIDRVFEEVDLLITPTTATMPHTIKSALEQQNWEVPYITVRNTLPFDFYGIPTISVPCGFSRSGLPIGLQISGPRLGEIIVLQLAHAYEQATDWHTRQPPIS